MTLPTPTVRQLLPEPDPAIDLYARHAAVARPAPPDRPWVLLNMVTSADGATAVDGVSGSLGGEADRVVFSAIRAVADVIVAAAGTVRADGYGPPRTSARRRAERESRGQTPYPRLAVVSRTLELDPAAPLFTEAPERTIVFTTAAADPARAAALAEVADVVATGDDPSVAPADVLAHLHGLGARTVLVEGGPGLNGAFLDADLVDELDVTIGPALVGGSSPRLATGAAEAVRPLRLAHLWEDDGVLLARYVRG